MEQLAPTGWIFMEFYIWVFFKNLWSVKFTFYWNLTMITGTSHEDLCTFMLMSRSVIRLRNVSDENCIENSSTRFVCSNFLLKIMPFMRCVEECGTAGQATDDIMQQMCSTCWITSGVPRGGVQTPPPEIPKALQNCAKLNPICETC